MKMTKVFKVFFVLRILAAVLAVAMAVFFLTVDLVDGHGIQSMTMLFVFQAPIICVYPIARLLDRPR